MTEVFHYLIEEVYRETDKNTYNKDILIKQEILEHTFKIILNIISNQL